MFFKIAWQIQMSCMDIIRAVHYNVNVSSLFLQYVSFTPSSQRGFCPDEFISTYLKMTSCVRPYICSQYVSIVTFYSLYNYQSIFYHWQIKPIGPCYSIMDIWHHRGKQFCIIHGDEALFCFEFPKVPSSGVTSDKP